jgi:uncharacterized protein
MQGRLDGQGRRTPSRPRPQRWPDDDPDRPAQEGTFAPAAALGRRVIIVEMTLDGADPQVLAPADCLRLLAGVRLGRVAISVNALPAILPVRFTLDHDEIVFRAPPGGVLAQGTRDAVVAFQADGSEPGNGTWSVLATGLSRHLADDDPRAPSSLPPWSSETDVFIALTPQLLSGRRLSACA